jgi:nitrate reductase NapE component
MVVTILRDDMQSFMHIADQCLRSAVRINVYVRDMESLLVCSFRHLGNVLSVGLTNIYGSFVWFFQCSIICISYSWVLSALLSYWDGSFVGSFWVGWLT